MIKDGWTTGRNGWSSVIWAIPTHLSQPLTNQLKLKTFGKYIKDHITPPTTLMGGTPEDTGMSQGPEAFTKVVCVCVCVCVWQLRHKMAKCPREGAQRMRSEVRKKSQVANKKISMPPRLEYEECAECLFVVRQEIRTKIDKFLEPRENETLPFTWCSCCYDLKVKLSGEVKGRHWGSPVPFKDRVPSCTGKEARLRQDWVFV